MSRETANSEFKNLKQGLQAGWYQTETYITRNQITFLEVGKNYNFISLH